MRNATHGLAPIPLTVVQDPCEDNRQKKVQRPDSERPKRLLDLTQEQNRDAIQHRVGRDLTGEGGEKAPVEADYQHRDGPGGSSSELQVMQSPMGESARSLLKKWGEPRITGQSITERLPRA